MKQFTRLLGFLGLLFISFTPTMTYAESGQTYEVYTSVLNVRDEPSLSGNVVGTLTKGNQIKGFKEHYGWIQTYYGGEEVWVAKHHLVLIGDTEVESTPNHEVEVTESSVNVRSGPGTNYPVTSSAFMGDTFNLLKTENDWYQVSLPNGSTGWIASWVSNGPSQGYAPEKTNLASYETNINNVNGDLSGLNIVLDPGHGGRDTGAIGLYGLKEKNIVQSTAEKVAEKLRNSGANVITTRVGDHYLSLDNRVQISNSQYTDVFISLHYNASPILTAQGTNTFYFSEASRQLAQSVQSSIAAMTDLRNRGIERESYYVLRNTNAKAILLELGFITNPYDSAIVQNADYQYQLAQAITDGLINYYN